MTNILNEQTLFFNEAPAFIEQLAGYRPSLVTLHRWRRKGLKHGRRLEVVSIGGRVVTSVEAIHRFFGTDPVPPTRRDVTKLERELAAEGI